MYLIVAVASLGFALYYDQGFLNIFQRGPVLAKVLLGVTNITLIGQDWVMFTAIHGGSLQLAKNFRDSDFPVFAGLLLPQAWSLGVEITFYAIAPFIVRRQKWLVSVLIASFIVRSGLLVSGIGFEDPWSYRFFPAEVGLFAAGALAHQKLGPLWERIIALRPRLPVIGTALFWILTVTYFMIPMPEGYLLPMYLAVSCVMLPVLSEFQSKSCFDRWIGQFSYPIYLGHSLVERILHSFPPHIAFNNDISVTLANVGFSLLLAFMLNSLIGVRVERIRERVRSGASVKSLSAYDITRVSGDSSRHESRQQS